MRVDNQNGKGTNGAAHVDARDAYRNVPILQQPTWKNEIASYFYLGGISGGAAAIAALAELIGGRSLQRLAHVAHWVAFLTFLPCPPLLIADLGLPSRFHHMLRIFKPSSPMNLGSWVLIGHGAVLTLAGLRTIASRIPMFGWILRIIPAKPVAMAELPLGLALGGYTGVLIGTTSIPLWSESPLLGGLFMASAMSNGTAAVSMVASITGESAVERDALAAMSISSGLADLALLGLYLKTSGTAARPLFEGRSLAVTSGGAAATASAVVLEAIAGRLPSRARSVTRLAAICTLLGGAALRFGVVHGGCMSAADRNETLRTMTPSERAPGWETPHVGPGE
jgi:formate-dependent nitrite reductase membrane component NrfD